MAGLRGGIDLGGTKIEAIVVDDGNDVVGQSRQPTPTEGHPADVAEAMAAALTAAAQDADIATDQLDGVGVGSPGDVDEVAVGSIGGNERPPGRRPTVH